MSDPTKKRQVRRHNHITKDLRKPKKEKVVKVVEDEDERRFRRYHNLDPYFLQEGYDPLAKDREDEDN